MAGFSSQDNMINALTVDGKGYRADWQKSTFATTAHTAGVTGSSPVLPTSNFKGLSLIG